MCFLLFQSTFLPWQWLGFAILEVLGFFYFLHVLSKSWRPLSEKVFRHKVFVTSLVIRLVWVVFSFFFFQYHTGQPFTFGAADSIIYHNAANSVLYHGYDNLRSGLWGMSSSDWGFPFYLSLIYALFGDYVIIPRIINAFLSAFTAILIYNIGKRNFGESAGRLAAIMAMLLPNFIYYTGIHLKETVMVFLIVALLERADSLIQKRQITAPNIFLIFLLIASLFFFRTVLGFSAVFALFSGLLLSRNLGVSWLNKAFISFWFVVIFWFFMSAHIEREFNYYYKSSSQQEANMKFRSIKAQGNRLATYGSSFVFLPFMFVAPFPTFVNIETQQQQMMLSGAYFIRNIYAFFVILALILVYKRKLLRKHILLLSFLIAYLFILAKSSFAISERFHMPVVPFLLILAAFGITQINPKHTKYYRPYLILIIIIILAWNWFKLAGRGAI
jgi:4-amino-4-deoxy-L-arabinose transferase-like glycosyltransferase